MRFLGRTNISTAITHPKTSIIWNVHRQPTISDIPHHERDPCCLDRAIDLQLMQTTHTAQVVSHTSHSYCEDRLSDCHNSYIQMKQSASYWLQGVWNMHEVQL